MRGRSEADADLDGVQAFSVIANRARGVRGRLPDANAAV
jgi:hypothetical protein